MRDRFLASVLTLILPALTLPALTLQALGAPAAKPTPTAASDTQKVSGGCTQRSYTTYGGLKPAPGDQRTAFICDTVIVTFQDAKRQHVALEFGVRGGKKDSPVAGFDGTMEKDGMTAKVHQMYLVRDGMNPADDGTCHLTFAGRAVTAAQCSASMHQAKNRWAAAVDFKAIP